jgi:carbon-monoxide dehydrogenase medium subunit
MKAFEYVRPSSVEQVCAALVASGGAARVLAGGTDLLVQMKQSKLRPATLVSLRDVAGLSFVHLEDDGALTIGAATPLAAVVDSEEVRKGFPAIAEAAACIGSVQVRTRATVGGNLCNAAPSADLAPILIAHGARVVISDGRRRRSVALEDFFLGPGQTALAAAELLVEIRVPRAPTGSFATYRRACRSAMDIAVVGVGALVIFESGATRVREARLVLGAVAPTPIRARAAEAEVAGRELDEPTIARAGALAAEEAQPISDVRASAAYRSALVEVLARRALAAARSWAHGQEGAPQ